MERIFIVKPFPISRQQAYIRSAQVSGIGGKIRQRRQSPRHHCIEKFERPVVFRPSVLDSEDIIAPKPQCRLLDESRLLAGSLDQGKAALRIDDGEREPRKAGAGADIGDADAAQVRDAD